MRMRMERKKRGCRWRERRENEDGEKEDARKGGCSEAKWLSWRHFYSNFPLSLCLPISLHYLSLPISLQYLSLSLSLVLILTPSISHSPLTCQTKWRENLEKNKLNSKREKKRSSPLFIRTFPSEHFHQNTFIRNFPSELFHHHRGIHSWKGSI